MNSGSRTLTISLSDVKFDPEDQYTASFKKESVSYYVYINNDLIGQSNKQNGYANV
jgi:hypothetical protein